MSALTREEGWLDYDVDKDLGKVQTIKIQIAKDIEEEVRASQMPHKTEKNKPTTAPVPFSTLELAFGFRGRKKEKGPDYSENHENKKKGPLHAPH